MTHTMLEEVAATLAVRQPLAAEDGTRARAAVAFLLCAKKQLEILFIERALCEADPWSGHLAFPGGQLEPGDSDLRAAAVCETWEEIGINFAARAAFIGQLDDVSASTLPLVVSCFVYRMTPSPTSVAASSEVARAFWFPVAELANPERRCFHVREDGSKHDAIDLRRPPSPLLWDVTYRLAAPRLVRAHPAS